MSLKKIYTKKVFGVKGFTLLEILVGLVVSSIIFVSLGAVFFKIMQDWKKQRDYLQCIENVRWAAEFMSNEIRVAGASQHEPSGNAWGWYKKLKLAIDPDGDGPSPIIDILYSVDPSRRTLIRGWKQQTGGGSWKEQDLANYVVDNPLNPLSGEPYPFFELDGNGLSTIYLTVRPRPGESADKIGNHNYTIRTGVRQRN